MPRFRTSARSAPRLVAAVLLLVGLVFAGVGVGFGWSSVSLISVAQRTEGKVIRLAMAQNAGPGQQRRGVTPVVEFEVDGQRHEFQSWLHTSPPQFAVGDKVTVLYDPRDVSRASIDSFVTLWLFPTIFGGVGGVLSLVAVVIFTVSWFRSFAPEKMPSFLDPEGGNFLDERSGA